MTFNRTWYRQNRHLWRHFGVKDFRRILVFFNSWEGYLSCATDLLESPIDMVSWKGSWTFACKLFFVSWNFCNIPTFLRMYLQSQVACTSILTDWPCCTSRTSRGDIAFLTRKRGESNTRCNLRAWQIYWDVIMYFIRDKHHSRIIFFFLGKLLGYKRQ